MSQKQQNILRELLLQSLGKLEENLPQELLKETGRKPIIPALAIREFFYKTLFETEFHRYSEDEIYHALDSFEKDGLTKREVGPVLSKAFAYLGKYEYSWHPSVYYRIDFEKLRSTLNFEKLLKIEKK